jgi:hypothetical protein
MDRDEKIFWAAMFTLFFLFGMLAGELRKDHRESASHIECLDDGGNNG